MSGSEADRAAVPGLTNEGGRRPPRRVPGEAGIWVLILGDLLVFGIFFLVFAHALATNAVAFDQGHRLLETGLGLANTLLLLSSSLFVALGVHRARDRDAGARSALLLGLSCGMLFVGVKIFEYYRKIAAGITPLTSDFFMYYFSFTGIHLLHVLLGIGILLWMQSAATRSDADGRTLTMIESGGLFWHLVDLLWIVLFALFYVLSGR